MIENNDDFEDIKKNFSNDNQEDLFVDETTNLQNTSDSQEMSMEDIFADIPPMPDNYEQSMQNDENVTSGAYSEINQDSDNNSTVTVQPVKFASFDDSKSLTGDAAKNLDNLLDIKLQLTVELGRTTLPVKKVLELTRGSIVELDKIAGEPVELYANGKLIAHGEVVVIEDNFGLRITSMSEPENKLNALK